MIRRATLAALAAGLVLVAAAPAQAATVTLSGSKSCYRPGDALALAGTGFTPGGQVNFVLGNVNLGALQADISGNLSSTLTIGVNSFTGVGRRTLTATDDTNPALTASAQFLGSALAVRVTPKNGAAGRKVRINATGFTTGKRLYAHIVRKRFKRNVFVGKLKGPCRTLKTRKRVLPAGTPSGVYTVQFDTRRKYSKKTKVWVQFTVTVTPRIRSAGVFGQPRLTQTVLFSR
jgi:hypothetical protein